MMVNDESGTSRLFVDTIPVATKVRFLCDGLGRAFRFGYRVMPMPDDQHSPAMNYRVSRVLHVIDILEGFTRSPSPLGDQEKPPKGRSYIPAA